MFGHNKRLERQLKEKGKSSWATVLESKREWASTGGVDKSPGQAGSITIHQKFRLRVEPEGEPPFEATVRQVFNDSLGWHIPQEDWSVGVFFDPLDHSKVVIDVDKMPVGPGMNREEAVARHQRAMAWQNDPIARRQQIAEMQAQASSRAQEVRPGGAAAHAWDPAAKVDVADQLTKLADLRDRGVLSEAEFEAQKARILSVT
jgi:hypothetical protein